MANQDRIDLDRVVNDPVYRRATIRRLNAAGQAASAAPAAEGGARDLGPARSDATKGRSGAAGS